MLKRHRLRNEEVWIVKKTHQILRKKITGHQLKYEEVRNGSNIKR